MRCLTVALACLPLSILQSRPSNSYRLDSPAQAELVQTTFPPPLPQVFKFGVYLAVPITLSWVVTGNEDILNAIVRNVSLCATMYRALQPAGAATSCLHWCAMGNPGAQEPYSLRCCLVCVAYSPQLSLPLLPLNVCSLFGRSPVHNQTAPHPPRAQRSYVVYPPEAPRPPSAEELSELINKQPKK